MSLEIRGLQVRIGAKAILENVSLSIGSRERIGLVGASGSGKSMLASSVMGLTPSSVEVAGSAVLDGKELVGAPPQDFADIRGRSVGFVFQDPSATLSPVATVSSQIELPLKRHYSLSATERRERVAAMLAKVGLPANLAGAYPHELSGGQQQRVGIACAVVTSPRLIIADEPTTALDAMTQAQIVELLVSLVDDAGASLLFITHDFSVLSRVAQRSYVLGNGGTDGASTVVEHGATADLLASPRSAEGKKLVMAARELTFSREASHE